MKQVLVFLFVASIYSYAFAQSTDIPGTEMPSTTNDSFPTTPDYVTPPRNPFPPMLPGFIQRTLEGLINGVGKIGRTVVGK